MMQAPTIVAEFGKMWWERSLELLLFIIRYRINKLGRND